MRERNRVPPAVCHWLRGRAISDGRPSRNAELDGDPGVAGLFPNHKRNRRHKIYFAIHKETETIRVFHVRHWARKPADTGELDDLTDDSAEQDG